MLIQAEQLSRDLQSKDPPTLLDVRWALLGPSGYDQFLAGHVPDAQFCDLDVDLAGPPQRAGRHPLPDPHDFTRAMRRLGVGPSRVVVYDAADSSIAARAWWCLRYFGHQDVVVLDGGLAAWQRTGLPVEAGPAALPRPGSFTAVPGGMAVIGADEVPSVLATGLLVDARAEVRYRGESEPIDPVAGHIPGALNGPTSWFVDERGCLLGATEIRSLLERLAERAGSATRGADLASAPVAAYCGSGVTASLVVLAAELAGLHPALYAGSWSEWISDTDRPIAVGDEPG